MHVGEDLPCAQEHLFAGGGKALKALVARYQRGAKRLFHSPNAGGKRRLGQIAGLGRLGEVAGLGESNEHPEIGQIDRRNGVHVGVPNGVKILYPRSDARSRAVRDHLLGTSGANDKGREENRLPANSHPWARCSQHPWMAKVLKF